MRLISMITRSTGQPMRLASSAYAQTAALSASSLIGRANAARTWAAVLTRLGDEVPCCTVRSKRGSAGRDGRYGEVPLRAMLWFGPWQRKSCTLLQQRERFSGLPRTSLLHSLPRTPRRRHNARVPPLLELVVPVVHVPAEMQVPVAHVGGEVDDIHRDLRGQLHVP